MRLYSDQVWTIDAFLDPQNCRRLLQSIEQFRQQTSLPQIFRPAHERSLRYSVINGRQVAEAFPELRDLYQRIKLLAEKKSGLNLDFMKNELVGININITPSGGEYRWHYDGNALTAILFLNEVQGGETEVYPGYRIKLKNKHSGCQKFFDGLLQKPWIRRWLGKKCLFKPQVGKILLMRGDECLHSVRAVLGTEERINILFSYERPGEQNPQEKELNEYLYTQKSGSGSDPNYLA